METGWRRRDEDFSDKRMNKQVNKVTQQRLAQQWHSYGSTTNVNMLDSRK